MLQLYPDTTRSPGNGGCVCVCVCPLVGMGWCLRDALTRASNLKHHPRFPPLKCIIRLKPVSSNIHVTARFMNSNEMQMSKIPSRRLV